MPPDPPGTVPLRNENARQEASTEGDEMQVVDRSDDDRDLDTCPGDSADGRNVELAAADRDTGE